MDTQDYTTEHRKGQHLLAEERHEIEVRLKDGWTPYRIAKHLGRPFNTIKNEIARGTVYLYNGKVARYKAKAGEQQYKENRCNSRADRGEDQHHNAPANVAEGYAQRVDKALQGRAVKIGHDPKDIVYRKDRHQAYQYRHTNREFIVQKGGNLRSALYGPQHDEGIHDQEKVYQPDLCRLLEITFKPIFKKFEKRLLTTGKQAEIGMTHSAGGCAYGENGKAADEPHGINQERIPEKFHGPPQATLKQFVHFYHPSFFYILSLTK